MIKNSFVSLNWWRIKRKSIRVNIDIGVSNVRLGFLRSRFCGSISRGYIRIRKECLVQIWLNKSRIKLESINGRQLFMVKKRQKSLRNNNFLMKWNCWKKLMKMKKICCKFRLKNRPIKRKFKELLFKLLILKTMMMIFN